MRTRGSRVGRQVLIGTGLLVLVIGLVARYMALRSPSASEFRWHQARYEALVTRIKQMALTPREKPYHLYLDASLRPETLSRQQAEGNSMEGKVTVWLPEKERYQITLVTSDQGHRGAFGYVYSDVPMNRASRLGGPDLIFLREPLNAHWWIAYNDTF